MSLSVHDQLVKMSTWNIPSLACIKTFFLLGQNLLSISPAGCGQSVSNKTQNSNYFSLLRKLGSYKNMLNFMAIVYIWTKFCVLIYCPATSIQKSDNAFILAGRGLLVTMLITFNRTVHFDHILHTNTF